MVQQAPKVKIPILTFYRMAKLNPIDLRTKIFSEYGDIARHAIKGITNYYFANPNDVKHILKDHDKNYFQRHPFVLDAFIPFSGADNLFVNNDREKWFRDRMTANVSFDPKVYFNDYAKEICTHTHQMVNAWKENFKHNDYIDLENQINPLVISIVATSIFTNIDVNHQDILKGFINIPELVKKRLSMPRLLWLLTLSRMKYRKYANSIKKIVLEGVQKRMQSSTKWDDMFHQFQQEYKHLSEKELSACLSHHLIAFFIVGFFTTASLIHWILVELSYHPDVERKISEEIKNVLGERDPTFQDIKSLKYLSMVIKEVLRLHAVSFAIMRQSSEEDSINGFYIPPKAGIIMSIHHIHRHPEFWDNPEGFDPERFRNNPLGQQHPYAYIPFGVDQRKCPGSSFAILEATIVVALLIRHFNLDLPSNAIVKPKVTTLFSMRPDQSLFRLRFK